MTYEEARLDAQIKANASGQDRGMSKDYFGQWHSIGLPQKRHRYGCELRMEVVSCENLDRCWPGHGPGA